MNKLSTAIVIVAVLSFSACTSENVSTSSPPDTSVVVPEVTVDLGAVGQADLAKSNPATDSGHNEQPDLLQQSSPDLSPPVEPVVEPPVGYRIRFAFDDKRQPDLETKTGAGMAAAVVGQPVVEAGGKVGPGSLSLDGNSCFMLPSSQAVDATGSTAVTVMAWVQLSDCDEAAHAVLSKTGQYTFHANCLGSPPASPTTRLSTTQRGGDTVFGMSMITLKAWHHIAVTWDGKLVTNYIDGVQVGQPARSPGQIIIDTGKMAGVGLGCSEVSSDGLKMGYPAFFRGKLDEVVLYDRAVTAQEIADYVKATR